MFRKLLSLPVVALLAGALAAQVPIPPHSSIYNGYSRGFNFTAQTNFLITQLELPLNAMQPGDTASFAVRINNVMALWSIGNVGPAIPTSIAVLNGDVVDVVGNWSPAVPGAFTAHNSYGQTTPYATVIEGVPHTLNRTGVQNDIGNPAWLPGTSFLAPSTGALGRVLMYTAPAGTVVASATRHGTGCVARYTSFYELFATTPAMDLSNTAFRLLNTGASYLVMPTTSTFVAPSATATNLNLGDESTLAVTLSGTLNYPGGSTTSLSVNSNGVISTGNNAVSYTPTANLLLNWANASWSVWHDFICNATGNVKFEEIAGVAYFTWDNVIGYQGTAAGTVPSTFQFQFDLATGNVDFVFQSMDTVSLNGWGADGYLVGFSPGGPSLNPGSTDLSTAVPNTIALAAADLQPLTFSSSGRPVQGSTIGLTTTDIPVGAPFGAVGVGFTNPALDLTGIGMPGCTQYSDNIALILFFPLGNTSTVVPYSVPTASFALGLTLQAQSIVYAPASALTPLGAIASNGLMLQLGDW